MTSNIFDNRREPLTLPAQFVALVKYVTVFAFPSRDQLSAPVRSFCLAVESVEKESNRYKQDLDTLVVPMRRAVHDLNKEIVALGNQRLASDFGYFSVDAGLSQMAPALRNLPPYFEKIDEALKDHPEVALKFSAIKDQVNKILEIERFCLTPELLDSLHAIRAIILDPNQIRDIQKITTVAAVDEVNMNPKYRIKISPYTSTFLGIGAQSAQIIESIAKCFAAEKSANQIYTNAAREFETFSLTLIASGIVRKFSEVQKAMTK